MKILLNGIFRENPVFVLLLGLCSTLAITVNFESSYMMAICVMFVLICTSIIVNLIKKFVPDNVKTPVYIVIISTFVTIVEVLLNTYFKDLYNVLGIYLPLIVVNCIILGRSISVYSKSSMRSSILDSIGISLGYMLSLITIGSIREILGSGTLTIVDSMSCIFNKKIILNVLPDSYIFPFNIFATPTGAFLTLGFILAIINFIKERKKDHE